MSRAGAPASREAKAKRAAPAAVQHAPPCPLSPTRRTLLAAADTRAYRCTCAWDREPEHPIPAPLPHARRVARTISCTPW